MLLVAAARAHAQGRMRTPEPLVGETVTDIDGDEPGEVEADLSGLLLGRANGGAAVWVAGAEIEARVSRRLGVEIELSMNGGFGGGMEASRASSLRAGASYVVFHDLRRGLHLMLEAKARVVDELSTGDETLQEPTDPALPYSFGLRGAWRRGYNTLRFGVDYSLGERPAYAAPFLLDVALLREFYARRVRGFFGLEVNLDFGRPQPLLIVPELLLSANRGESVRVGVGLPILVEDKTVAVGGLLRVVIEQDVD